MYIQGQTNCTVLPSDLKMEFPERKGLCHFIQLLAQLMMRGMDTISGEATLSKFFPFRVDPFSEEGWSGVANEDVVYLASLGYWLTVGQGLLSL